MGELALFAQGAKQINCNARKFVSTMQFKCKELPSFFECFVYYNETTTIWDGIFFYFPLHILFYFL